MLDQPSVATPATAVTLLCAPAAAGALLKHPALKKPRARRPRRQPLRQTWHDTADFRLAARDLALSDTSEGWHLDRLGLGWPRRPGTAAARIGTAMHPAGLQEQLGEPIPGPLRAFGRLEGEVVRFSLPQDGAALDCIITIGAIRLIDAQGIEGEDQPVARIELAGPSEAALALAQRLAVDLPVLPSLGSLPQQLLAQLGVKPKPPPPPPLAPEVPTEQALAVLASGFVSTFLTRLAEIENRTGPEAVHQARVTLRRLRALMLAFRPILRDSEDVLKPLLARLKAVLGPARDWDVFLSETLAPLEKRLPSEDPAVGWLRAAATARREAAYATLIDWLRTPAFRALSWRLVGLCLGEDWIAPPSPPAAGAGEAEGLAAADPAEDRALIGAFAVHCIESRWKKTARPARELVPLPIPALHELRIKCKKLRYQAEMFQDSVPGKAVRRLVRRLAETQEVMGLLNDGAVATELALSLRPGQEAPLRDQLLAAEAIGLIHGYGIHQAQNSRDAVIEAWRKLVKSDPL